MNVVQEDVSPAAVGVARVAVRQGVVLGELRSDDLLRRRLCDSAGEASLSDLEWSQVATLLSKQIHRKAMASPKSAGECKRCGQAVVWVTTTSGKSMPLDPLPHPNGNVVVKPQGRQMIAFVHSPLSVPLEGQTAYRAHPATCPRAAKPRRLTRDAGPVCAVCGKPMDRVMWSHGERTHPCCLEVAP